MSLTGKGVYKYVCTPNRITIIAKDSMLNKKLEVELCVNEKTALYGSYEIRDYTPEEADERVKVFCNGLIMFTEDEIQEWVEADRIMLALNAYRFLNEVRTSNGKLIWRRSKF